ncbi:MAG: spore coat protein YlbD [Bacilli bacterium]|jgi:hypothetical protein
MSKIDQFKTFVRKHPNLVTHVNSGRTTWQKLFEMWDLYGEEHSVWNEYLTTETNNQSEFGLGDVLNNLRNINVDSINKGLSGLQKALSLAQELFVKRESPNNAEEPYIPRPIHRHFDD